MERQGTLFGEIAKRPDDDLAAAEAIYQEYPRKLARGKAIEAIRKALKVATVAELLDAVRAYTAAIADMDSQFVPYPATWFNQQRWLDDRSEWTAHREAEAAKSPTAGIDAACDKLEALERGDVIDVEFTKHEPKRIEQQGGDGYDYF